MIRRLTYIVLLLVFASSLVLAGTISGHRNGFVNTAYKYPGVSLPVASIDTLLSKKLKQQQEEEKKKALEKTAPLNHQPTGEIRRYMKASWLPDTRAADAAAGDALP